jgi:predicted transcriptional regulator
MMKKENVYNMRARISIDIECKVSDAREKMREEGLRKIVVTKQGSPVFIMLEWKVLKEDGNKLIGDIIESLDEAIKIPIDEDINNIRRDLQREPALVVMDYNDQMVGVVTANDLYKSMSKMKFARQWKR